MSPHIKVQWIGVRKDSGRGAVWGWFTEVGKKETPNLEYGTRSYQPVFCHIFWGSIGKKLYIEETELTTDFLYAANCKQKNFKAADAEKTMARWGKCFEEELSMYLLMLRIKG